MRVRLIISMMFCVSCVFSLQAQDPNFTQFYAAPLYLNPAFAGTAPHYRITTNYRKQWHNLPNAYDHKTVAFDYQFDKYNSGLGVLLEQHHTDRLGVQNTQGSLIYAYRIRLNQTWNVQAAMQATYTLRGANFNNFIFEDELQTDLPTQENLATSHTRFFDLSSGVIGYNETFWIGLGVYHLLKPRQSLDGASDPLPMKFTLHGGAKLPIGYEMDMAPALLFQHQGKATQLDLGTNFYISNFVVGMWYRGLPLKPIAPKILNQDAIAVLTGYKYRGFYVGFSYDFRISGLKGSGGSYEIALMYHPFHDRRNKGNRHIKCPTF